MYTEKLSAQKHSADIQCHFLRTLSPQLKRDEVLQYIAEQVQIILQASACSIYIVDEGGKTATQCAGDGYQRQFIGTAKCEVVPEDEVDENHPIFDERLGITGWILSTGKSFLARTTEEVINHPHRLGTHDPEMSPDNQLSLRTFLGVPIRGSHGDIIGALKAERRCELQISTLPFSVEEQIVLETVARVTSKSLSYLKTARTRNINSAITAWARDVISEASITESDLDGFLSLVVNVVASAMHADSCGIFLTDPAKNTLTQRAGTGSQQRRSVIRSYILPKKENIIANPTKKCEKVGLTAWIAATGKSYYAKNFDELQSHPHHLGQYDPHNFNYRKEICGAFLGVPLQVAGDIVGTLKVENISNFGIPDLREFDKEAHRRFDVLAQDIALAIVLFQQHATDPYQVIINAQETIFQILRGDQDVETLVNTVVNKTMELLNARACSLLLKEGNMLIQPDWAAVGYSKNLPGKRREYALVRPDEIIENPKPDEKVGLTVWIAVKQKKFTARSNTELKLHPHHKGIYDIYNFDKTKGEQCESFMGVPLIVGDELLGVLKVESKKKIVDRNEEYTYFNEQDELVFDLIARSIAIAIENARLSESRRFAEHIRANSYSVLPDLHKFVFKHTPAVETLNQVAKLLKGDKDDIARIVENYAALLQPDFQQHYLNSIPDLVNQFGDFLEGGRAMGRLYIEFSRALSVFNVEGLADFCSRSTLGIDVHPSPQFFLAEPTTLFIEMLTQIKWNLHSESVTRSNLETTVILMEDVKNRVLNIITPPEQSILLRIIEKWLGIIKNTKDTFNKVVSPYIVGVPIDPIKSPFFGRHDVFEWVTENLHGVTQKNILVFHGERRIGKTSILLQLEKGKLGEAFRNNTVRPICPVYVDLQGLNEWETGNFLRGLSNVITKEVYLQNPLLIREIKIPELWYFRESPFGTFQAYLSKICSLLGNKLLVLMIDEFELLDTMVLDSLDKKIFDQLRYLMQHLSNLTFIFAGKHELEDLSPEYRGLIQSIALIREVSYLSKEDSESLIRQPVKGNVSFEDAAVDELWQYTNGHPYLIQYLCHELIQDMNKRGDGNFIVKGHVTNIIQKIVFDRHFFLNNLWNDCQDQEKAVLFHLAKATHSKQHKMSTAELQQQLTSFTEGEVLDTINRLRKRKLIEKNEDSKYSHTIKLFSLWIYKNLPDEQQIKWLKI